jgi:hypothetical protein
MYLFIFIGHFGLGQKKYFQNNKSIFIFLSDILVWVKKNIFKIINLSLYFYRTFWFGSKKIFSK